MKFKVVDHPDQAWLFLLLRLVDRVLFAVRPLRRLTANH